MKCYLNCKYAGDGVGEACPACSARSTENERLRAVLEPLAKRWDDQIAIDPELRDGHPGRARRESVYDSQTGLIPLKACRVAREVLNAGAGKGLPLLPEDREVLDAFRRWELATPGGRGNRGAAMAHLAATLRKWRDRATDASKGGGS